MRTYSLLISFIIFSIWTSGLETVCAQEVIRIDLVDEKRDRLEINIEKIIPLETSDNCLIGWVSKVKYFDNRFIVLNSHRFKEPSVLIFDDKGKFIAKTKKGKGPGEVIEPFAITVNRQDSLLILHDQASKPTRIYDLDLNYINSIKHEYIFMTDLHHINADTFMVYNHTSDFEYTKGKRVYYNRLYTKGFSKTKRFDIPLYGKKYATSLKNPVSIFNSEVLFLSPWNYNIFQLIGSEFSVRYTIDFGKFSFSSKELELLSSDELLEKINSGKRVATQGGMIRNNDFMVITTYYKKNPLTFLRSMENNQIYCLNDGIEDEFLPFLDIKGVTDDGFFYAVVEPDEFIKYQESSGKYKDIDVDEEDNPYIVMFKIKEPRN